MTPRHRLITYAALTPLLTMAMTGTAFATPALSARSDGPDSACFVHALKHFPQDNWTCVGETLTFLKRSTAGGFVPRKTRTIPSSPRELPTTRANRIDDYHANSNESIYAFLGGSKYKINFNFKIGLHNHSGNVAMRYSSASPVSLTYSLRIRRDVNNWPDDTVYGYEGHLYGSSAPTRSYSRTESHNGNGHNKLPRDGKRYFWDAHDLHLRIKGTAVATAGSVQSDRTICYKTTSCKFKQGNT